MKHILISGSTGFLGKTFVRQMLEKTDHHLYLLVRSLQGTSNERRNIHVDPRYQHRITRIEADIIDKNIFRKEEDRELCESIIDEVVHMAASVEFKESKRAEIFEVNLEGTRNMLKAASRFKKLTCFNHISTTYVSGNRLYPTVIAEAPLEKAAAYKNPYEESKHLAEQAVMESGLPWTIMRPSIILGSKDGTYFSDNTIYVVCNLFFNARLQYLEQAGVPAEARKDMSRKVSLHAPFLAKPDAMVNVINVDVAADMIIGITESKEKTNKFFHISSPEAVPVDTLIVPLMQLLNIDDVYYAEKKDVKPETLPPYAASIFWPMKALAGYLSASHPVFTLENTTRILGKEYIDAMPRFDKDSLYRLLVVFLRKVYPDYFPAVKNAGKPAGP